MSTSDTSTRADESTGRIPLSSNLGLLCMFDKGDADGAFGPRHLVVHGWRLHGELDLTALRQALDDVVARHEMLRTEIVRDDGEPHQRVHPPSSPEVVVHDLPRDDPRSRAERVDDFVNEVEAGSLDVGELPHLRAVVGRFDDQDAVLVLVTHHTASDGWSLHVLIRDLASCYAARRGIPVPVLPDFRQYREYAVRQREVLAEPSADASRDFWRRELSGTRILDIRADRRVSAGTPGVYSVHRFLIDEELTSATLEFARAMRCSPFMVLMAAFNALLHGVTSETDPVIPVITSGRGDPSFYETVGPFFNMVPLRTTLTDCRSFSDLVLRTRSTCLNAYAHELPFSEVAGQAPEITRTYERDDNAVCAIQVLQFPGMTESETIGDLRYSEVRRRTKSHPRTSDIPNGVLWGLDILPTNEIAGTIRFNGLQFDASTVVEMVDGYRKVLREGLSEPTGPLPTP